MILSKSEISNIENAFKIMNFLWGTDFACSGILGAMKDRDISTHHADFMKEYILNPQYGISKRIFGKKMEIPESFDERIQWGFSRIYRTLGKTQAKLWVIQECKDNERDFMKYDFMNL